ncbi:DUF4113 domain-containing protein [Sphingomonas sp. So64.6b]|nr:DUF4113 domain-containing protein [Sphingomonas sp. So64.6b]
MASLFPSCDPEKSKALMTALDSINGRFSRYTMRPASTGRRKKWRMRRVRLSPVLHQIRRPFAGEGIGVISAFRMMRSGPPGG